MQALCLGELLVDFVCPEPDVSLAEAPSFTRAPGGAPANVAVGLQRLGIPAGFLGCVGRDPFGDWLAGVVAAEGVNVDGLVRSETVRTTLAFIATRSDGRKDITFYRNPGADAELRVEDLDLGRVQSARLFHFCSVSLSREPARAATLAAADAAKAGGALISFDPNWRAPLWDDPAEARAPLAAGLDLADIVKVADEELEIVCGTNDIEHALDRLLALDVKLAVVTRGADGAAAATAGARVSCPGYEVDVVDPLGAGDAFVAALLAGVLASPPEFDHNGLFELLEFANAAGALATQGLGVIPSLPTRAAIASFRAEQPTRRRPTG